MRSSIKTAAVLVLIIVAMSLATRPGSAHERRNLGPYQVVVGWLEEPAFAGVANAVDFRVTDTRSTPAKPVEGLEKTLTVQVFQGGSTTPYNAPFRTRSGNPGAYAADIIPTREGSYRFVVKGKIDTLEVNETFETGPGRFDEIRPITQLQYPDKVPAGAELGRTLDDIRSTADQVRIIAIVALVLAAVAVALSLIRRRS